MKTFATLATLVCMGMGMINAALLPSREAETLSDATNSLTYVGPITPGGENITLSGSAESIHSQILALNSSFNPDDFEVVRAGKEKLTNIEKRSQVGGCCRCLPGTPYANEADTSTILQGYLYLMGLPGYCGTTNSGVSRVSCSYNAAIYLVNTHQAAISAPCTQLGLYAAQIATSCNSNGPYNGNTNTYLYQWSNGQICDSAGYCTIVAGTRC